MTTKTASQLSADMKASFDADIAYARKRKATLNTPAIKDGFKLLAAATNRAEKAVPGGVRVASYVYSESTRVNGDLTLYVTSLKDRKVVSFLAWVEAHVAEFKSSNDYVSDSAAQRTFVCRSDTLELAVTFALPLSGDACSRVQVGTTLKEVPQYELRCA